MRSQRNRGTYAKLICLNCRARKIKCALPEDFHPATIGQAQPPDRSCERCRLKGLSCVVDYTTLGRPSKKTNNPAAGSTMVAVKVSPGVSSGGRRGHSRQDETLTNDVGEFLLTEPRQSGEPQPTAMESQRKVAAQEKFMALISPSYFLSTLLARDSDFAAHVLNHNSPSLPHFTLNEEQINSLDQGLAWHKMYYPDVPHLHALHNEVQNLDQQDLDYIPSMCLLVLLCTLAVEAKGRTYTQADRTDLETLLRRLVQRLILTLPWHRYAVLALEIIAEYKPLAFATDRTTAAYAVRGKLISPLATDIARNLRLHRVPEQLKTALETSIGDINDRLVLDCVQWYRICLHNTSSALAGDGREHDDHLLKGESVVAMIGTLTAILECDQVSTSVLFAVHSLLCFARGYHSLITINADRTNAEHLDKVISSHKHACGEQQTALRRALQKAPAIDSSYALALTQLVDFELHNSYCNVTGSALFFCVMATSVPQKDKVVSPEQALDLPNGIIDRFTKPTESQYATSPHTQILIKYGDPQTDNIAQGLSNFIAAVDNLMLDGISLIPPMRSTTCTILASCRNIMEGNATRMKGWGGLHDRVGTQLLLIRESAAGMERLSPCTNALEAVRNGCLWASTARVLRKLCVLLQRWRDWCALGKAEIFRENRSVRASDDSMEDLLPEDLFFEWDLWLADSMQSDGLT